MEAPSHPVDGNPYLLLPLRGGESYGAVESWPSPLQGRKMRRALLLTHQHLFPLPGEKGLPAEVQRKGKRGRLKSEASAGERLKSLLAEIIRCGQILHSPFDPSALLRIEP